MEGFEGIFWDDIVGVGVEEQGRLTRAKNMALLHYNL
jgi:hypothetical protein